MISYVSTMDGLFILGMYLLVALLWRDAFWIRRMSQRQAFVLLGAGLVIAAVIEYKAVFLSDKWSYNAFMPTVFGLGISPLVQLSVTGILAVWLTRRLLYQKGIYHDR